MSNNISILVPEGNTARVVVDRSKRLKGMFLPCAPELLSLFAELPAAPRKAFAHCWGMLAELKDRRNRVVYVETKLGMHEALKVLEDKQLIVRPNASQWRRIKGYTTVLINPYLVLTTDERMHELWELIHPGAYEDSELVTGPSLLAELSENTTAATPVTG